MAGLMMFAFILSARPTEAQTNLSLNRPTQASTTASATYASAYAVDGKTNTQWRSNSENNPWIQVDLGSVCLITRVTLNWSTYYAKAYILQSSGDAVNWTNIRTLSGQNGATDDITSLSTNARYLRLYTTQRSNTRYGVWLTEMTVLGNPPDATAPTVPVGLASSNLSSTSFTLTWSPSTDNVGVTGYDVYRNGVLLSSVTSPSLPVTGLSASTTYQMTVRARDAAGNASAQSIALAVTTLSSTSSSTKVDFESWPSGTLASNPYTGGSQYRFTGMYSANGALDPLMTQTVHGTRALINSNWSSKIRVDRSDGASFALTSFDHHGDPWDGSCDATVTGYRSNGTTVSTTYTSGANFATLSLNWTGLTRVEIDFQGGVNNSYGLVDNFMLSTGSSDTSKPTVPQGLAASNLTPSSFTLTWSPSTDNVAVSSYDVYRNGVLHSNVSSAQASVTGLSPTTTYSMTVVAKDATGNQSAASSSLSVTTLSAPSTGRRNSVGINLANPGLDWGPDKPFADAMRSHRRWIRIGMTSNDPEPPLDADYWPTTDAQCLVWAGLATRNNHGTYRLSFQGQATVAASTGSLSGLSYDAATNTTSGSLTVTDANNADLYLTFTNTRKTSASSTNTGVTEVRLMRPITPGSATSHPTGTLFTDAFLSQLAPYTTLRSLGWVAVNWNQDSLWSDRTLMRHARQSPPTGGKAYGWEGRGASYESLILLANTARKDVWLTVPHKADADYMLRLAQLFRYGSDGVNPYTSVQSNPAYPPLDPSLKLYVEYSNEIWNDQFSQTTWVYAQARNNSAVKFDGKTDPAQYQYLWGMRYKAVKTVELSNAFRSVFGADMMVRIRPVVCFQKGYIDRTNQTLTFMDAYYNRRDSRSTWNDPKPVNHYLYGAGGSFYWYTDNSAVSLSTIWTNGQWDAAKRYNDAWGNPAGYYDQLTADAAWARQFGLSFLNYEGDMHPTYQGGDEAVIKQMHTGTWDTRMLQNTVDHLNVLNRSDVELGCFLNLNGLDGSVWAVRNTWNPSNSPQTDAIVQFNAATPLSADYRNAPPFTRAGAAFDTREWQTPALNGTGSASITANGSYNMSYAFNSPDGGSHTVTVNYSTNSAAGFAVEYNGNVIGTFTPGSTSGAAVNTPAMSITCTAGRMHSIRIVALSGSVTVQSITVNTGSPAPASSAAMQSFSDGEDGFHLSPNPSTGILNLVVPRDIRFVEIIDMSGRMLRRERVDVQRITLDVSGLAPGSYVLSAVSESGKRTIRRFQKR